MWSLWLFEVEKIQVLLNNDIHLRTRASLYGFLYVDSSFLFNTNNNITFIISW